MKYEFQKLEYPKIIELESDLSFIIAEYLDISHLNMGVIHFKGSLYNYDDCKIRVIYENVIIDYSTKEVSYSEVDLQNNIIY